MANNSPNQQVLRDTRRAENRANYDTNNPHAEDVKARNAELAKDRVRQQSLAKGATPEEAEAEAVGSGYTSLTPRLDQQARQQSLLDAKNKPQAPVLTPAESQNKFLWDVEKSKSFGDTSALLSPEGVQRAQQAAEKAGFTPEAGMKVINDAATFLKSQRNKSINDATAQGDEVTQAAENTSPTPPITPPVTTPTAKPAPVVPAPVTEITPTKPEASGILSMFNMGNPLPDAVKTLATGGAEVGLLSKTRLFPKVAEAFKGAGYTTDATKAGEAVASSAKALADVTRKEEMLRRLASSGRVTSKAVESAMNATAAAAKVAGKAEKVAKVAKFLEPVAKTAGALKGVGSVLGKVATPLAIASEAFDTARFIASPEQREAMAREVESDATKYSGAGGALYSGLKGTLSPTKTILGTGKLISEAMSSDKAAKESAAAADTAQRLSNALTQSRRNRMSDEQFKALPVNDRVNLMKSLRKGVRVAK